LGSLNGRLRNFGARRERPLTKTRYVAFGSGGVSDSPKQNVSSNLFAVVGISLSNHAMWCYLQVMWGFNVSQATHCPHAERARRSLPSHGPPTHKPVVSSLSISTLCGAVPI
jgi:hypothetical protein